MIYNTCGHQGTKSHVYSLATSLVQMISVYNTITYFYLTYHLRIFMRSIKSVRKIRHITYAHKRALVATYRCCNAQLKNCVNICEARFC